MRIEHPLSQTLLQLEGELDPYLKSKLLRSAYLLVASHKNPFPSRVQFTTDPYRLAQNFSERYGQMILPIALAPGVFWFTGTLQPRGIMIGWIRQLSPGLTFSPAGIGMLRWVNGILMMLGSGLGLGILLALASVRGDHNFSVVATNFAVNMMGVLIINLVMRSVWVILSWKSTD